MTPPVQPESELQKLAADFKAFVHWAELKLHLIHQTVDPSVAAQPISTVPPSTTTTFGGTEPAGTVGEAPAVETCNGVPVPSGMTLESFTQLVGATSGVAAQLADPNLHASLLAGTQAWWDGFGPYYREEFLAQTGNTIDLRLMELYVAFRALHTASAVQTGYTITPDQQTAANLAAGVK